MGQLAQAQTSYPSVDPNEAGQTALRRLLETDSRQN